MKRRYVITTDSDASPEAIAEALRAVLPDVLLEPIAEEEPAESEADREARIARNLEIAESMWGVWADEPAETLEELRAKAWGYTDENEATPKKKSGSTGPLIKRETPSNTRPTASDLIGRKASTRATKQSLHKEIKTERAGNKLRKSENLKLIKKVKKRDTKPSN